eukprot:scaffold3622_cov250-Pinguiococcus_pyrenoidosus.AAC.4
MPSTQALPALLLVSLLSLASAGPFGSRLFNRKRDEALGRLARGSEDPGRRALGHRPVRELALLDSSHSSGVHVGRADEERRSGSDRRDRGASWLDAAPPVLRVSHDFWDLSAGLVGESGLQPFLQPRGSGPGLLGLQHRPLRALLG